MHYIYIYIYMYVYTHKILPEKHPHVYQNNPIEFNFRWILNQEISNFPCKTVNIETIIIIQIKRYMHFLSLDKGQHSTSRNVTRILFVYTSSVYFRNFNSWILKSATIFVKYTSCFIMIITWLTILEKMKIIHINKTIFLVSMNVFISVTLSSLTETVPMAMLFPFCCEMNTTCKHLCFPLTAKFKEISNEVIRSRINFCIILTNQPNTQLVR